METNILNEIKRTQTLMGVENINAILESEKNKGFINEVKIKLKLPTKAGFNKFKNSYNNKFAKVVGLDDLDYNAYIIKYQGKSIDNINDLSNILTELRPYWVANFVQKNGLTFI